VKCEFTGQYYHCQPASAKNPPQLIKTINKIHRVYFSC